MAKTPTTATREEQLKGVPADQVDAKVAQYKASRNYLRHTKRKEDKEGSFWTIIITFKA